MKMKSQRNFSYHNVLLEEIALEGRMGLTLQGLWVRLASNEEFSRITSMDDHMKKYLWRLLCKMKDIFMFKLPELRPDMKFGDGQIHLCDGFIVEQEVDINFLKNHHQLSPYELSQQENIRAALGEYSYAEIIQKYGNCLVMVASLAWRQRVLKIGHLQDRAFDWNSECYSLLEEIGRSRRWGCLAYGKNSLECLVRNRKRRSSNLLKLQNMRLIERQTFPFLQRDGIKRYVHLFHLTRFFVKPVTQRDQVLEQISSYVKSSERNLCAISDIPLLEEAKSVFRKKLLASNDFKKDFQVVTKPYSIVFPNSSSSKWESLSKKGKTLEQTIVRCITQRSTTEEEESPKKNPTSNYLDESFFRRISSFVHGFGSKGASVESVKNFFQLDRIQANRYLEGLFKCGLFFTVTLDKGRTRSSLYVHHSFSNVCPNAVDNIKHREKVMSLKRPLKSESDDDDDGQDEVPKKKSKLDPPDAKSINLSSRTLARQKLILKKLTQYKLLEPSVLYKHIILAERDTGYVMDSRSLVDLLCRLEKDGFLVTWHVENSIKLVSEPSVTEDDELYKSFLQLTQNHSKLVSMFPQSSQKYVHGSPNDFKSTEKMGIHSASKFSKLREIHHLLQYLTRHHGNRGGENLVYGSEGGICVPPLPAYYSISKPGWMVISDVIPRIPLRLYALIFHMKECPLLLIFLNDKDKQYTPIGELPVELREKLIDPVRMVAMLKILLNRLVMMGLLQYGPHLFDKKEFATIYLNEEAFLMESSKGKVIGLRFRFDSMYSVHKYWYKLQNICWESDPRPSSSETYEYLKDFCKPQDISTVHQKDAGYICGDGKGPAGLDSVLNAHYSANWSGICNGPSFTNTLLEEIKTDAKTQQVFENSETSEVTPVKPQAASNCSLERKVSSGSEEDFLTSANEALSNPLSKSQVASLKHILREFFSKKVLSDPEKNDSSCKERNHDLKNSSSIKQHMLHLRQYLGPNTAIDFPKLMASSREQDKELFLLLQELYETTLQPPLVDDRPSNFGKDQQILPVNNPVKDFQYIDQHIIRSLIYSGLCSAFSEGCKPYQYHLASQAYPTHLLNLVIKKLLRSRVISTSSSHARKLKPFGAFMPKYKLSLHGLAPFKCKKISFDVICDGWTLIKNLVNGLHINSTLQLCYVRTEIPDPKRNDVMHVVRHLHQQCSLHTSEPVCCCHVVSEMVALKSLRLSLNIKEMQRDMHETRCVYDQDSYVSEANQKCDEIKVSLQPNNVILKKHIDELSALKQEALSKVSRVVLHFPPSTEESLSPQMTKILNYVENARESGITAQKLEEISTDVFRPLEIIAHLEQQSLIWKVGDTTPRWVSYRNARRWACEVPQNGSSTCAYMIAKPWIRVDSSVNRRVLDRFTSCVLLYILDNPGIQCPMVTKKFCPALIPVWIEEILEILIVMKCITPYYLNSLNCTVKQATLGDYYGDKIFYEPSIDALSRLAVFIGDKDYTKIL